MELKDFMNMAKDGTLDMKLHDAETKLNQAIGMIGLSGDESLNKIKPDLQQILDMVVSIRSVIPEITRLAGTFSGFMGKIFK